mmetsp:Transcript_14032/g.40928  ORF Transcript_14032/g.40928 Transcript_14032/m.40928 type:complete len:206 (+) Transcript_14032:267-884(+)
MPPGGPGRRVRRGAPGGPEGPLPAGGPRGEPGWRARRVHRGPRGDDDRGRQEGHNPRGLAGARAKVHRSLRQQQAWAVGAAQQGDHQAGDHGHERAPGHESVLEVRACAAASWPSTPLRCAGWDPIPCGPESPVRVPCHPHSICGEPAGAICSLRAVIPDSRGTNRQEVHDRSGHHSPPAVFREHGELACDVCRWSYHREQHGRG